MFFHIVIVCIKKRKSIIKQQCHSYDCFELRCHKKNIKCGKGLWRPHGMEVGGLKSSYMCLWILLLIFADEGGGRVIKLMYFCGYHTHGLCLSDWIRDHRPVSSLELLIYFKYNNHIQDREFKIFFKPCCTLIWNFLGYLKTIKNLDKETLKNI